MSTNGNSIWKKLYWALWACDVIWFVLYAYSGFYDYCDRLGQVPHTATVDMFMARDWLTGEERVCLGMHDAPSPNAGQITTLACPDSPNLSAQPHSFTVKF